MVRKEINVILLWFLVIFTIQLAFGLKALNAQFTLNNHINIKNDVESISLIDTPERITDQILILFIDGMRFDKMVEANTPNIDRIKSNGTTFSEFHAVLPSYSMVNLAAFATGSTTNFTRVYANGFNKELEMPALFSIIESTDLNKSIITSSNAWIKHVGKDANIAIKVEEGGYHTLREGEKILAAALESISSNFTKVQMICFEDVDVAGHEFGANSPTYLEIIEKIDDYVGEILDLLNSLGKLENTTIVVYSDHGHDDLGGHGDNIYDQTHATLIISGRGVKHRGYVSNEKVFMNSITPTLLAMLGLPLASTMNGKVLLDYVDVTNKHKAIYLIQTAEIISKQFEATIKKITIFSNKLKKVYQDYAIILTENITEIKDLYDLSQFSEAIDSAKKIEKDTRSLLSVAIQQFTIAKRTQRTLLVIALITFPFMSLFFLHRRKILMFTPGKYYLKKQW